MKRAIQFPDFLPQIRILGPLGGSLMLREKETRVALNLDPNTLKSHLTDDRNILELRVRIKVETSPTERVNLTPQSIIVKCGKLEAHLDTPRWTKVEGDFVNEIPVLVSPLITRNKKNVGLTIIIDLLGDKRATGIAGFFISRKVTTATLKKSILLADPLPEDFIENRKKDMVEAGVQFEIVSLKCPCLGTRIKIPARFDSCRHAECFDLENFLSMEEKKPKGRCPICNNLIELRTLGICQFTRELIKKELNCSSYRISPKGIEPLQETETVVPTRKRKRDKAIGVDENTDSNAVRPRSTQHLQEEPSIIIID